MPEYVDAHFPGDDGHLLMVVCVDVTDTSVGIAEGEGKDARWWILLDEIEDPPAVGDWIDYVTIPQWLADKLELDV